jgi:hypothetical protein
MVSARWRDCSRREFSSDSVLTQERTDVTSVEPSTQEGISVKSVGGRRYLGGGLEHSLVQTRMVAEAMSDGAGPVGGKPVLAPPWDFWSQSNFRLA